MKTYPTDLNYMSDVQKMLIKELMYQFIDQKEEQQRLLSKKEK